MDAEQLITAQSRDENVIALHVVHAHALMAELVDALGLGPSAFGCGGSTPSGCTQARVTETGKPLRLKPAGLWVRIPPLVQRIVLIRRCESTAVLTGGVGEVRLSCETLASSRIGGVKVTRRLAKSSPRVRFPLGPRD